MRKITKPNQLTKNQLACYIESHHLYIGANNSKSYYKYSTYEEIKKLLKLTKAELLEMFNWAYDFYADETEESGFYVKEKCRSEM